MESGDKNGSGLNPDPFQHSSDTMTDIHEYTNTMVDTMYGEHNIIYLITEPGKKLLRQYKIGTTHDLGRQILVYQETMPQLEVICWFEHLQAYSFRRMILSEFHTHRILTTCGQATEWLEVDPAQIHLRLQELCSTSGLIDYQVMVPTQSISGRIWSVVSCSMM